MALSGWINQAAARLEEQGVESSRLEAQVLAAHSLRKDRSWILAHPEWLVDEIELESLLSRRLQGEPLAYITGKREFYGRSFWVDKRVLIPRHETETLIDAALELIREHSLAKVADICTGSGCIGITLKLERPDLEVWAGDISAEALEVARLNATQMGADIIFEKSDLLRGMPGGFDLIVSNPPYIGESEPLPREVVNFEPHKALFAGHDGLAIYHRLAQEAAKHIRPGGWLIVEMGDHSTDKALPLFELAGWAIHPPEPDLSGTPRAAILQRPANGS